MKKGFTLIEMLVVVLIIGILAAIAFPQYQKAVRKARFAEMQTYIDALAKASEVYTLTNGTYPTSLKSLDVSVTPSEKVKVSLDMFALSVMQKTPYPDDDVVGIYYGHRNTGPDYRRFSLVRSIGVSGATTAFDDKGDLCNFYGGHIDRINNVAGHLVTLCFL